MRCKMPAIGKIYTRLLSSKEREVGVFNSIQVCLAGARTSDGVARLGRIVHGPYVRRRASEVSDG